MCSICECDGHIKWNANESGVSTDCCFRTNDDVTGPIY